MGPLGGPAPVAVLASGLPVILPLNLNQDQPSFSDDVQVVGLCHLDGDLEQPGHIWYLTVPS